MLNAIQNLYISPKSYFPMFVGLLSAEVSFKLGHSIYHQPPFHPLLSLSVPIAFNIWMFPPALLRQNVLSLSALCLTSTNFGAKTASLRMIPETKRRIRAGREKEIKTIFDVQILIPLIQQPKLPNFVMQKIRITRNSFGYSKRDILLTSERYCRNIYVSY